jgi:hypothetical protein
MTPDEVYAGHPRYSPRVALPLIYETSIKDKLDINQENAKIAVLKQRQHLLKLDELEGKLIPIEMVEDTWQKISGAIRARILSMPSKLAPRIAGTTDPRKVEDELIRECHEALIELSNYEPSKHAVERDPSSSEEDGEPFGTASFADD